MYMCTTKTKHIDSRLIMKLWQDLWQNHIFINSNNVLLNHLPILFIKTHFENQKQRMISIFTCQLSTHTHTHTHNSLLKCVCIAVMCK